MKNLNTYLWLNIIVTSAILATFDYIQTRVWAYEDYVSVPSICADADDITDDCYFNCTSGESCSDEDADGCCVFYAGDVVTAFSEVNALAQFAEICDHASWDHSDHLLNWCYGQNVSAYFEFLTFGKYQSDCVLNYVTDPCTGDVIFTPVNYEPLLSSSMAAWDGLTCDDSGVDNDYGNEIEDVEAIELSEHHMYCSLENISFTDLTNLYTIDLSKNNLYGGLPDSLGDLQHLFDLDLDDNRIDGTLPESWSGAYNLHSLEIENNRLTGTIPSSWFEDISDEGSCSSGGGNHLTKITDIQLANNSLEGPLPAGMACTDLSILDLSYNAFDGGIPDFEYFTGLTELDLNNNDPGFHGSIPASLGSATNVELIDLSHNQLNGSLPATLAYLTNLVTLDISQNSMLGYIPELPSSLTTVDFTGDDQRFWCPFPNNSIHAVAFESIDCTCMAGSYCPSGFDRDTYYSSDVGSRVDACEFECTQCSSGKFNNQTFLDTCTDCAAGRYMNGSGAIECDLCEMGTYLGTRGGVVCLDCDPGKDAATMGRKECAECAVGKQAAYSGTEACTNCTTGRYAGDEGTVSCGNCSTGSYQDRRGATSCSNCTVGTYAARQGQTTCDDCKAGFKQAKTGQAACDECTEGTRANEVRTACGDCPLGTYGEDSAGLRNNLCANCSVGTHASTAGSTICEACHGGKVAVREGMAHCRDCAVGKHQHSAVECLDCLAGEYQREAGQQECDVCEPGSLSNTGATSCFYCSIGKYWQNLTRYTESVYDNNGNFLYGGWNLTCLNCSVGRASASEGATSCDACDPGTYADVSGLAQCQSCNQGRYTEDAGLTKCQECSVGFYQAAVSQTSCDACPQPPDDSTVYTVALSNASIACNVTPAGYAWEGAGVPYTACDAGSYAHRGGGICIACSPGTYASASTSKECIAVPAGYYQSGTGRTSYLSCKSGTYSGTGASFCRECVAGKFASNATATNCTLCPAGKYQSNTGQSSCDALPSGYASEKSGVADLSTDVTVCDTGFYTNKTGSTKCTVAQAGYYTHASDPQTHEIPCPSGTFSDHNASISCESCPAGKSTDGKTAQTSCTACDECRFEDESGASTCKFVPGGAEANSNKTRISSCAAGSYSDNETECVCEICPKDTYSSEAGSASCTACSSGLVTLNTGSTSADECLSSTDDDDGCDVAVYCYFKDDVGLDTGLASTMTALLACSFAAILVLVAEAVRRYRKAKNGDESETENFLLEKLEMYAVEIKRGNPSRAPPPPPMIQMNEVNSPNTLGTAVPIPSPNTLGTAVPIPSEAAISHPPIRSNKIDSSNDIDVGVLYDYDPQEDWQLKVSAGEKVNVVEWEDGGGWSKIMNKDGISGSVPTSYIIRTSETEAVSSDALSLDVGVLYDYEPQEEWQLKISAGEKVNVVEWEDGGGWSKITNKDGVSGSVPTSYLSRCSRTGDTT